MCLRVGFLEYLGAFRNFPHLPTDLYNDLARKIIETNLCLDGWFSNISKSLGFI